MSEPKTNQQLNEAVAKKLGLTWRGGTIIDSDGATDSLFNDYFPTLMIHIWTKGDTKVTRGNKIAKRILINIDSKGFVNITPCIYQIWKDSSIEIFEDDTQTFHKILSFNVVMQGYSD